jgi:hypothetical protein
MRSVAKPAPRSRTPPPPFYCLHCTRFEPPACLSTAYSVGLVMCVDLAGGDDDDRQWSTVALCSDALAQVHERIGLHHSQSETGDRTIMVVYDVCLHDYRQISGDVSSHAFNISGV